MLNKLKENNVYDDEIIYGQVKPIVKYKKRGRKPKGGKIIQNLLREEIYEFFKYCFYVPGSGCSGSWYG